MNQQHATGAAEQAARGSERDVTGRATNEPRLQSEVRADKLKGDARTAGADDATDAIADAAERATHPPMNR
jgi:uncharacterized protein YjbJ (UPF0337 family)